MITDAELIFWIISGIVGVIGFAVLWAKAKKAPYVEWVTE